MIFIKKVKNILFFLISILVVLYLFKLLGITSFFKGLIISILPIFFAFFISICLETPISKFVSKGYKRKRVVIFTYLLLLLLIVGLLSMFLPPFVRQMQVFINTIPNLVNEIESLLSRYNLNFNLNNLGNFLQIRLDKIINYFSNIFDVIISIGIAISASFFISLDYNKIKESIKSRIPHLIKEETIYFFKKYIPFFSKYIYSLLIDSIITFIISFTLFTIFKVEYSLIGALIITITNLIPIIGPLLGIVPLVVIGYSVSSYFALISLIIVLLVQLLESNIIQPLIFKNVIKIHPVEEMMGILIFSYIFGTIGMIFSPLLVVAFKLLFIEKYEKETVTL